MTTTRRRFLLGATTLAATPLMLNGTPAAAAASQPSSLIAYVGSRTTRTRAARGQGITVWQAKPGSWAQVQLVTADDGDPATLTSPNAIPVNPSFLTLDTPGRFLYAVHGDAPYVSAFAVDQKTGLLTRVNTVDTGRANPVYLSVDPTGRWLVVAHLADPGSVMTLPILKDGSLGRVTGIFELPGTADPHKSTQLGPNPQHAPFDLSGRWIIVPDRGIDRVFIARLDPDTGQLSLHDTVTPEQLAGPRHFAFNPRSPYAYVADELRSTVTTYGWDAEGGTLSPLGTVRSTQPDMTDESRAANIAVEPSGRFVYVSNRSGAGVSTPGGPNPDTIGVFRVDDGDLTPVDWVPSEGLQPRFFSITPDGQRLYAANEASNTIVEFSMGHEDGLPRPTGEVVTTGSPVCIVFKSPT